MSNRGLAYKTAHVIDRVYLALVESSTFDAKLVSLTSKDPQKSSTTTSYLLYIYLDSTINIHPHAYSRYNSPFQAHKTELDQSSEDEAQQSQQYPC
jgi:hypothetical protein